MSVLKKIAVGLSGGIDSAVSALLLKQRGFNVTGVFMNNWKQTDTSIEDIVQQDAEDAKWVCDRLGIPFKEVSFGDQHWKFVVQDTIANYNVGLKSNPDVILNEFITFGCLYHHCRNNFDVDAFATGHYAQLSNCILSENHDASKATRLLKGTGSCDQSFCLGRISQPVLQRCIFPVGSYTKSEVEKIALENSFDRLLRKERASNLYSGKSSKLHSYVSKITLRKPGQFIDIDTGDVIGEYDTIFDWSNGQRCSKNYIVAHNNEEDSIFVVSKENHPALYCHSLILTDERWIVAKPESLVKEIHLNCKFRSMCDEELKDCTIIDLPQADIILLHVDEPLYAAVPGRHAVFYQNDECLGSAKIRSLGPSNLFLSSAAESDTNEEASKSG